MLCKNCGANIEEKSKFCGYCGSKVELENNLSKEANNTFENGEDLSDTICLINVLSTLDGEGLISG